ncbi:hypothetical protein EVAR_97259_1 [Eumeta japonica]|uniref:Uncharacterized protein n=1 Tax=Eumeta variegata TaxID=151549 RepID=A0A4C1XHX3_EUMVA|nr:hypothetical protein EVAR_97259_1 [Eumeta japonica]
MHRIRGCGTYSPGWVLVGFRTTGALIKNRLLSIDAKKYNHGGSKAVRDIDTGDESWIYAYDPETRQQSTLWVFQDEPNPTKASATSATADGLAPEGASQTKKFCLQVIKKRPRKKFCLQVIKKRPRKPDVADVHEWCSAATDNRSSARAAFARVPRAVQKNQPDGAARAPRRRPVALRKKCRADISMCDGILMRAII